MQIFTFDNSLFFETKDINQKKILKLEDNDEKYFYDIGRVIYPHDKIFKEVLDKKVEVIEFLNKMLKLKYTKNPITENMIEKYNRKFITEDFYNIESDIIYKLKNKNIFFLIEHQSKIDTSMPYRMLKYIIAIMDSCIDKTKLGKKGYKLPRVYSFVIYTGKEKWNVENNFENMREEGITLNEEVFPNFKVMDINDYTNKELLEEKNLLSKMMLLEKAQNIEELEENLQNIADRKMKEENKIFIKRVVKYIFREKLSEEKYEEIIKKLEDKKMAEFMFLNIVQDYIEEEIKKGKKKQENEIKSELENKIKNKLENKIKNKLENELRNELKNELKNEKNELDSQKEKLNSQKEELDSQKEELDSQKRDLNAKAGELNKKELELNKKGNKIIIEMIKNKIDEKMILKITKIDKEELEKIKKDNNLCYQN